MTVPLHLSDEGLPIGVQFTIQEERMETVITVAILIALGAWAYKSGKRDGSRAGYSAGRRKERRRIEQRRTGR